MTARGWSRGLERSRGNGCNDSGRSGTPTTTAHAWSRGLERSRFGGCSDGGPSAVSASASALKMIAYGLDNTKSARRAVHDVATRNLREWSGSMGDLSWSNGNLTARY